MKNLMIPKFIRIDTFMNDRVPDLRKNTYKLNWSTPFGDLKT